VASERSHRWEYSLVPHKREVTITIEVVAALLLLLFPLTIEDLLIIEDFRNLQND
jgi:hypothetical protein